MDGNSRRTKSTLAPAIALCVATGCSLIPEDPEVDVAAAAAECEYEVDYDEHDPNDYVWTVTAREIHSLAVLGGDVEINYRRYAAGTDRDNPENAQSSGELQIKSDGRLRTHGPLGGELTVLAEDISYRDLIEGFFTFHTLRSSDNLALTSCTQTVGIAEAIESHNELLAVAGETIDTAPPANVTDPAVYAEYLREMDGVILLVDDDCAIPNPENTSESRSVLSWLAVTIEGRPAPRVIDPFRVQGLNFDAAPGEGNYCQDSPYDWSWDVKAYTAQTQVGNARELPGDRSVNLYVNRGLLSGGLEAETVEVPAANVQVDPDPEEGLIIDSATGEAVPPQQGLVLTDFAGQTVITDRLAFLIPPLDDEEGAGEDATEPPLGFELEIERDGAAFPYARCRVQMTMDHLREVVESGSRLVVSDDVLGPEAPANQVSAVCDDGYFAPLGLHHIELGLEMNSRMAVGHAMPPRPDLSDVAAAELEPLAPAAPEAPEASEASE